MFDRPEFKDYLEARLGKSTFSQVTAYKTNPRLSLGLVFSRQIDQMAALGVINDYFYSLGYTERDTFGVYSRGIIIGATFEKQNSVLKIRSLVRTRLTENPSFVVTVKYSSYILIK